MSTKIYTWDVSLEHAIISIDFFLRELLWNYYKEQNKIQNHARMFVTRTNDLPIADGFIFE